MTANTNGLIGILIVIQLCVAYFLFTMCSARMPVALSDAATTSTTRLPPSLATTPTTTVAVATQATPLPTPAPTPAKALMPTSLDCTPREATPLMLMKEQHYAAQQATRSIVTGQALDMVLRFGQSHEFWLLQADYPCEHTVLVGNRYCDGAKLLCNPHWVPAIDCRVFSFGIAQNIQFETDLVRMLPHCRVFGFDPTPAVASMAPALEQLGGSFHGWGLMHQNTTIMLEGQSVPAYDLATIRALVGDNLAVPITILKIDIEGHEWVTLYHLFAQCDRERPVAFMLMIELHLNMGQRIGLANVDQFVRATANCGYRVYAKDPNHWDPLCIEVALVHENYLQCEV